MTIESKNYGALNVTNHPQAHEKRDFLLNQENFECLMKVQREIEDETQMRPTFKKLINTLMTKDALLMMKKRLIEQMS
ncbi:MAG: hypothetical protein L0H33_01580 [Staphylococcus equorum]|nr:hypothetical protein [Staphylococcus equorum]